jgi:hypothetical protein
MCLFFSVGSLLSHPSPKMCCEYSCYVRLTLNLMYDSCIVHTITKYQFKNYTHSTTVKNMLKCFKYQFPSHMKLDNSVTGKWWPVVELEEWPC